MKNKYQIIDDLNDILFNTDSFKEFYNESDLIDSLELDILEYYNLKEKSTIFYHT